MRNQKFETSEQVLEAMKIMFKDVMQEALEAEIVSNITNRVMPLVTEWQNRPLDNTYSNET